MPTRDAVIVEAVALSAMVSNSLILPFLARDRWRVRGDSSDMAGTILQVRRGAIVAVLLLAWLYYQATDQSRGLAAMGLVSFAAMAQYGAVLLLMAAMTISRGPWIGGAVAALLVAAGKLNKQVADELGIAIRTVEVHRARAFLKMGLRSAAELAALLERLRR